MEKKIKLARYRKYPYIVNCPKTNRSYKWAGSMGNKIDIKEVSQETFDWLFMETNCFPLGSLVIVDKKADEEFKNSLLEEEYQAIKNNTNTAQEIAGILTGNTNTMKAELRKITSKEEKSFVIEVAREIGLDSVTKINFLNEWVGAEVL